MKKEYKLGKIAITGADLKQNISHGGFVFANKMDYETALRLIEEIQDVWLWRLPTIEELKFLQGYHELRILNFSNDAYWTSDIIGDYGDQYSYNHYAYYFNGPRYGGIPKTQRLCVRLVRDI
jgi:hypothetical protein